MLLMGVQASARHPHHAHKKVHTMATPDPFWATQPGSNTYVVKPGDTLPKIAARKGVYAERGLWFALFTQNRDLLKKTTDLKPGMVLTYRAKRMGLMPGSEDGDRARKKAISMEEDARAAARKLSHGDRKAQGLRGHYPNRRHHGTVRPGRKGN